MRNLWKKLSAMLLTSLLLLSTAVTALAANQSPQPDVTDDRTTGSLTVTKEGATFKAYKVAAAVRDGQAYEYTATPAFASFFGSASYGSYTLDSLSKMSGDGINTGAASPSGVTPSDEMADLTLQLQKFQKVNSSIAADYEMASGSKQQVGLGWYLVVESSSKDYPGTGDDAIGKNDRPNPAVASKAMLVSVPLAIGSGTNKTWNYNVTMYPKDDAATITKKIVENSNRIDTNTGKIDDVVKYEIISTIPTYDSNVLSSSITYNITDTMSKGLTYNNDISVKAGSDELVENTHFKKSIKGNGPTVIELVFDYGKIKDYAEAGTSLVITLSGTLNTKAVVGTAAGNPNDVLLKYTNNPSVSGSYNEIPDEVITYLWGFGVNKVDADKITEDLAGAQFSLKDNTGKTVGKYTYNEKGEIVVIGDSAKVTTDKDGMVYFTGLDEGIYKLYEDKAPAGYKILKTPVEIILTGKKDAAGNYTGEADMKVTNADNAASKDTDITLDNNNILFQIQVKDHPGILLPSTGGPGTAGFYIGGALLLIAAAGIFLFKCRRKTQK